MTSVMNEIREVLGLVFVSVLWLAGLVGVCVGAQDFKKFDEE